MVIWIQVVLAIFFLMIFAGFVRLMILLRKDENHELFQRLYECELMIRAQKNALNTLLESQKKKTVSKRFSELKKPE